MKQMTRQAVIFACAVVAYLLATAHEASAQSNCANVNNATLASATSITMTPAYQPFSGSALTYSFNMTVQNTNSSPCSIALIFVRPTAPLVMTSAGFTLNYNLDFNGSNIVNIGYPSSGYYLTAPGNGTGTFSTYTLTIPANQTSAAAGNYADHQVGVDLYAYRFRAAF